MDVPGADRVEWRAVAELVPYARNARTHSDEQIGVLAASIGRFGFNNPVIVDAAGGIMAGHGRVLAASRLGMERVPVVRIDHLDEDEKRAFILADNKIADMAGYDEDLLRLEAVDLADKDFDLSGLGFSDKDLGRLLVEPDSAEETKGRVLREWVARGDNHFHNCRIYNMALADRVGISRSTSDEGARLAADRGQPPPLRQGDLLAGVPVPPVRNSAPGPAKAEVPAHRPRDLSRRLA